MSTAQSDDFLVIESHSVEDDPEVVLGQTCIGEPLIRNHVMMLESVDPSRSPRDLWPTARLDCGDSP